MKVFTSAVAGPLILLVQAVYCLHFYLDTAQTRCFFEELPRNTLVIGKIDAQEFNEHTNQYEKNPALNLRIAVMVCIAIKIFMRMGIPTAEIS